jgi:LysM repeat protein
MRKALVRILALVAIGGCGLAIYLVLNANHVLHKHHPSATATATTPSKGKHATHHYTLYRVKNGDSLGKIAEQHHVTVAQIERLNPNIDPQALHAGQHLHLR